jgi:hypothetical protein
MERPSTAQPRSLAVITNGLVIMWSLIMVGVGLGALGDWHYHATTTAASFTPTLIWVDIAIPTILALRRRVRPIPRPTRSTSRQPSPRWLVSTRLSSGWSNSPETPEPARDTAGRHHGPSPKPPPSRSSRSGAPAHRQPARDLSPWFAFLGATGRGTERSRRIEGNPPMHKRCIAPAGGAPRPCGPVRHCRPRDRVAITPDHRRIRPRAGRRG